MMHQTVSPSQVSPPAPPANEALPSDATPAERRDYETYAAMRAARSERMPNHVVLRRILRWLAGSGGGGMAEVTELLDRLRPYSSDMLQLAAEAVRLGRGGWEAAALERLQPLIADQPADENFNAALRDLVSAHIHTEAAEVPATGLDAVADALAARIPGSLPALADAAVEEGQAAWLLASLPGWVDRHGFEPTPGLLASLLIGGDDGDGTPLERAAELLRASPPSTPLLTALLLAGEPLDAASRAAVRRQALRAAIAARVRPSDVALRACFTEADGRGDAALCLACYEAMLLPPPPGDVEPLLAAGADAAVAALVRRAQPLPSGSDDDGGGDASGVSFADLAALWRRYASAELLSSAVLACCAAGEVHLARRAFAVAREAPVRLLPPAASALIELMSVAYGAGDVVEAFDFATRDGPPPLAPPGRLTPAALVAAAAALAAEARHADAASAAAGLREAADARSALRALLDAWATAADVPLAALAAAAPAACLAGDAPLSAELLALLRRAAPGAGGSALSALPAESGPVFLAACCAGGGAAAVLEELRAAPAAPAAAALGIEGWRALVLAAVRTDAGPALAGLALAAVPPPADGAEELHLPVAVALLAAREHGAAGAALRPWRDVAPPRRALLAFLSEAWTALQASAADVAPLFVAAAGGEGGEGGEGGAAAGAPAGLADALASIAALAERLLPEGGASGVPKDARRAGAAACAAAGHFGTAFALLREGLTEVEQAALLRDAGALPLLDMALVSAERAGQLAAGAALADAAGAPSSGPGWRALLALLPQRADFEPAALVAALRRMAAAGPAAAPRAADVNAALASLDAFRGSSAKRAQAAADAAEELFKLSLEGESGLPPPDGGTYAAVLAILGAAGRLKLVALVAADFADAGLDVLPPGPADPDGEQLQTALAAAVEALSASGARAEALLVLDALRLRALPALTLPRLCRAAVSVLDAAAGAPGTADATLAEIAELEGTLARALGLEQASVREMLEEVAEWGGDGIPLPPPPPDAAAVFHQLLSRLEAKFRDGEEGDAAPPPPPASPAAAPGGGKGKGGKRR